MFSLWLGVSNFVNYFFAYRIVQNFERGNFDGYWLFKYLTEKILTDGHCLSPYICKCCTVFKQFDGLNFDGLAGKHQKRQNFPPSKSSAIRYLIDVSLEATKLLDLLIWSNPVLSQSLLFDWKLWRYVTGYICTLSYSIPIRQQVVWLICFTTPNYTCEEECG